MAGDPPYKAIVIMDISIHEVLKTGECSGEKMPLQEMQRYGFNNDKIPVIVKGQNKYECIKKLVNKIQEFNDGE
jgi:hypothetical protein